MLLQSLKNFQGKGGVWATSFVPFFIWISQNNKFDEFVYTLSYSIVRYYEYKKIIEKNEKEILGFIDSFRSRWLEIVQKESELWYEQNRDVTYYFSDGYVSGVGQMVQENAIGPWEFFNADGRQTAQGNFDNNGNREGEWIWFNESSDTNEIATYNKGKLKRD